MEVASPLSFVSATGGAKRSLTCSPELVDASNISNLADLSVSDENHLRASKRRRFYADTSIDSLSEDFSSQSIFYKNSMNSKKCMYASKGVESLKWLRQDASSPINEDLKKKLSDQAAEIETLKADKANLVLTLANLQSDHDRIGKDNQILRRAVTIQQDRLKNAENDLKTAHKQHVESDERIRTLESMIISLRYHLQAQQSHFGNDFMHECPPDVF